MLPLCSLSFHSAPPAIPELFGTAGAGGNPVSAERRKGAAQDCANAATAAEGVTASNFGPGEKAKKKRHTDTQDVIDKLFTPHNTEVSKLEAMVGDIDDSLKGSPRKQKKDREEQLNRLINQYKQSAKNKKELGQPYDRVLKKIEELKAERDAL